ncbi:MAG TPA: transglutaminase family protein, partial [Parachlamydiaceae bacterium]|nr:transglutaminase family protein [Parachlamydiaceae bacterium]
DTLIHLSNKPSSEETRFLTKEEAYIVHQLAKNLPNRKKKGFYAADEKEVLQLESEEIDLARALFLSQFGNSEEAMQKLYSYEAMIDLMALQILARLEKNATPEEKIAAMNALVFDELRFRFPPHSLYAKDVDLYTFLPSVLDSRQGVCLGVSILYICLAERLDLNLEMVTPPGHIYVRYKNGERIINIETTARGIHLSSDEYLSVDTKDLELRSKKQVIGLAHFNLAASFWEKEEHEKIVAAYQKALPYLPDDMQLKELLGFAYVLSGDKTRGEDLLEKVKDHLPDYAVSRDFTAKEFLEGLVGLDGIRALFKPVNEKRSSILDKKEALQNVLKESPHFTSGIFSLATTWLQLHREKEALALLERYHALDPNNATAEYYLAALYTSRYDYNKAWEHLLLAEKLVKERAHNPKALKELKKELTRLSPYNP